MVIEVRRPRENGGRFRRMKIVFDGEIVARIWPGQNVELHGNYQLQKLYAEMDWFRSDTLTLRDSARRRLVIEVGFLPGATDLNSFEIDAREVTTSPSPPPQNDPRVAWDRRSRQRELLASMPAPLRAVAAAADDPTRERLLERWDGTPEPERRRYRRYLDTAGTDRQRGRRSRLAAERLLGEDFLADLADFPAAPLDSMTGGEETLGDAEGLPAYLAEAVSRHSADVARQLLDSWQRIGEAGRERYRTYLSRARTQRSRRKRCQLALLQLLDPDTGLYVGRVRFHA